MTDPAVIRTLAHPARVAILAFLGDGPATATECSAAAGRSPSSCSYHLRTLAGLGFVEEVESDDGRERKWRLKTSGHGIPKSAQTSPEVQAAARLWGRQWIGVEQRRLAEYLAHEPREDPAWRAAATFFTLEAHLTPDEVIEVAERFSALMQPYDERDERDEQPEGSRPVRFTLTAYPRPPTPVGARD